MRSLQPEKGHITSPKGPPISRFKHCPAIFGVAKNNYTKLAQFINHLPFYWILRRCPWLDHLKTALAEPCDELVGRLVPGRAKPVRGRPLAETGRTTCEGPEPLSWAIPAVQGVDPGSIPRCPLVSSGQTPSKREKKIQNHKIQWLTFGEHWLPNIGYLMLPHSFSTSMDGHCR